ncbi:MAG: hypothetical protein BMS9Abin39_0734 [Ignavibacteria bacterium]|nr:MAG: hypothetical protein BMS9Abin39_0734 [Ignavibacteria bacterium]
MEVFAGIFYFMMIMIIVLFTIALNADTNFENNNLIKNLAYF